MPQSHPEMLTGANWGCLGANLQRGWGGWASLFPEPCASGIVDLSLAIQNVCLHTSLLSCGQAGTVGGGGHRSSLLMEPCNRTVSVCSLAFCCCDARGTRSTSIRVPVITKVLFRAHGPGGHLSVPAGSGCPWALSQR